MKTIDNKKTYKALSVIELEREPVHPGEILLEEFLKPLNISQTQLAKELGVSFRTINEIINQKRSITPEMAIRLSQRFGTTPEFWLNGQNRYDLWKAYKKLQNNETYNLSQTKQKV